MPSPQDDRAKGPEFGWSWQRPPPLCILPGGSASSLELLSSPAGGCAKPRAAQAWGAGPSAPAGTPPNPLPPALQVNMVIGILVFNKLVSKDGITDKKLKERAG